MNEDIARLDHGRLERQGFPEVVMASGKTPQHVAQIMAEFATRRDGRWRRARPRQFAAVAALLPRRSSTRSHHIGSTRSVDGMERHHCGCEERQ
jgi:hypothetical protein